MRLRSGFLGLAVLLVAVLTAMLGFSASAFAETKTLTPEGAGAPSLPGEVQTEPARRTRDGFRLRGELNPEGSPTTYYFAYIEEGLITCPEWPGLCAPETSHGGPLTGERERQVPAIEVTGLIPGTTYRYWLIAQNDFGTAVGRQLTFTTPRRKGEKGERGEK